MVGAVVCLSVLSCLSNQCRPDSGLFGRLLSSVAGRIVVSGLATQDSSNHASCVCDPVCVFLLGPGRTINPRRLQNRYVVTLISFESTRYVWGGENRFGIDCSGLIRKGLIESCFEEGLMTVNPRLIRSGLEFWWHDCSARALKTGYRNWTQLQFTSPRILDISLEQLEPGDIAVTSDGIHVLAYLGSGEWIEADPGVGKVLRIRPRDSNSWLTVPVHILRWKILTSQDR